MRGAGRLALLVLGVVVVLVACGVPEDDRAQQLPPDQVPFGLLTTPSTTTTTPINLPPSHRAVLYFLESPDQLVCLPREVENRTADTVITTLVETSSSDLQAGFTTAIPPGTELRDTSISDRVLTVDLSEEFRSIQGESAIAAVAQIVFTATDLPGVNAVEFRVEGEDIQVSDQDGAQQPGPVSQFDFNRFTPTSTCG